MELLIGLGLAVLLLWGWLKAHWFARVLVTIVLAPICALFGMLLFGGVATALGVHMTNNGAIAITWFGAACMTPLSWLVAGLPTYYRRPSKSAAPGSLQQGY